MPCSPCNSTGTQKDKDGNDVACPRCRGTGEAVRFLQSEEDRADRKALNPFIEAVK
jgi:DnaJ-class molecular chaperone